MKNGQWPILYIHGFRGGDYTTQTMIASALKANNKKYDQFLKANIDWRGKVTYEGTWTEDEHPIVQVVFKNKWVGSNQIAYWLAKLLFDLRSKHKFTTYAAIGHSLGAVALVLVNLKEKMRPYMPKLKKLVLIAGPFNGVLGLGDLPNVNRITPNGRPAFMSPTYFRIFINRNSISDDLRVINIYGNVGDHSNSDKYISVTSAESISYILKPRVKEYREYLIKGSNAEHSMLHDDSEILDMVNNFIYYNPLS
ncbi:alpha/beta hydrolase [Companilactobacillus halodurans]|uniref:Alpha/beta hydrolase n=1 Tax=Companilactobacillus halodurans TaxID=2584183 RepID=A0A5P0ZWF2_9LACO|nr:alpha/beta hydrolase [Companilactobacillus halodurans]MQS97287.1 alpha/beta hydrolase [Companilactobacillus halodurans]